MVVATDEESKIAVIGLAVRVPGAKNSSELWNNLKGGIDSISRFSERQLTAAGEKASAVADPAYVRARGTVEGCEEFDSEFFGIQSSEADLMDPQHRVFLETCYLALEDSGYVRERNCRIDIYAGTAFSTYLLNVLLPRRGLVPGIPEYLVSLGNEPSFLAPRVSYKLGLTGASVNVDTACSTGLVAVHLACQSLLSGQCDVAVAGAVSIFVPQISGYRYYPDGIKSPDGFCRPFDVQSGGFVDGSGSGAVVLKRLDDALRDNDLIHAVICGSAINNDGGAKIGFTSPSVDAQSNAIADALAFAGLTSDDIDYVEAHGTATKLGDPIEVAALSNAFSQRSRELPPCLIGSIKSNIGHLGPAAGIAGLAKAILSLENSGLPPSLHFSTANPEIDFESSLFQVNAHFRTWERGARTRRAGVTSLGMGGTNAHVIVEEAPVRAVSGPSRPWQILTFSAKTPSALKILQQDLRCLLLTATGVPLADMAYTLASHRTPMTQRGFVVCRDHQEGAELLPMYSPESVSQSKDGKPHTFFLFPGPGNEFSGMACELIDNENAFSEPFDECLQIAQASGCDLRAALRGCSEARGSSGRIAVAETLLFAIEYSLARMWMSWNIEPNALLGASLGEYVAACLSGVFSLQDALELTIIRGRLVNQIAPGAMLLINRSESQLLPTLRDDLSLAAVVTPDQCIVAGPLDAVRKLELQLQCEQVWVRRLCTPYALHSGMMDVAFEPLLEAVSRFRLRRPTIPFVSNVTGTWITGEEATSCDYWAKHLGATVRLSDCLQTIGASLNGPGVGLELGSGGWFPSVLTGNSEESKFRILPSLSPEGTAVSEIATVLQSLGELWAAGAEVDWIRFFGHERRHRVPVPSYPFQHRVHWLGLPPSVSVARPELYAPQSQPQNIQEAGMSAGEYSDVTHRLKTILASVSGESVEAFDNDRSFLELGFDSIGLLNVSNAISEEFDVAVSLQQLLEQAGNSTALTAFVKDQLLLGGRSNNGQQERQGSLSASDYSRHSDPVLSEEFRVESSSHTLANAQLNQIVNEQLKIMRAQLGLLGALKGVADTGTSKEAREPILAHKEPQLKDEVSKEVEQRSESVSSPFRMFRPSGLGVASGLGKDQQKHLDNFVLRYCKRTQRSKERTQSERECHADPRANSLFDLALKELAYPIVAERSHGPYVWDLDGNKYVDIAMGFGVHLFGHQPSFVVEAIRDQLDRGMHLGPQSSLAGDVARRICRMTSMDRVVFCNSGTEAVMTALRLARAVTGRTKVALFAGSYHGTFDGTLAFAGVGDLSRLHAITGPPGTPPGMVKDLLILQYGSSEALEVIGRQGEQLAAVLVEPIQSRYPGRQFKEFLRSLREITSNSGAALIFDEVITGFRLAPGGGQEWASVRADLATYGKVIGGGMPIGAVGGKARFLDAVDGGWWSFGDDSYPRTPQTVFAGTFCKHPLTMAAAAAVLKHLEEDGGLLQRTLADRTSQLVSDWNVFFEKQAVPVRAVCAGSQFGLEFAPHIVGTELILYRLIEKGVYAWEGRTCFLSTAHAEEDIRTIFGALCEAIVELRDEGLLRFPGRDVHTPRNGRPVVEGYAAKSVEVPLTEAQRQLWVASKLDPEQIAYSETIVAKIRGDLDSAILHKALADVVARHDALRTTFDREGRNQRIAEASTVDFSIREFGSNEIRDPSIVLERLQSLCRRPFDLERGPLLRLELCKLLDHSYLCCVGIHHLVTDTWSSNILFRELFEIYEEQKVGGLNVRPPAVQFATYARELSKQREAGQFGADLDYWSARFPSGIPRVELPCDYPFGPTPTLKGSRSTESVDAELWRRAVSQGAAINCTPFVVSLALFQVLLSHICHSGEVPVAIHLAGQATQGKSDLVGYCINILPICTRVNRSSSWLEFVREVRTEVTEALKHPHFASDSVRQKVGKIAARESLQVAFNLERTESSFECGGLTVSVLPNNYTPARWHLSVNAVEQNDRLDLAATFKSDLFAERTVSKWLTGMRMLIEGVAEARSHSVGDMLGELEKLEHRLSEAASCSAISSAQEKFRVSSRKPASPA